MDNVEPSPLNDVADITPLVESRVMPVPTFIPPNVPTPVTLNNAVEVTPVIFVFPLTSNN